MRVPGEAHGASVVGLVVAVSPSFGAAMAGERMFMVRLLTSGPHNVLSSLFVQLECLARSDCSLSTACPAVGDYISVSREKESPVGASWRRLGEGDSQLPGAIMDRIYGRGALCIFSQRSINYRTVLCAGTLEAFAVYPIDGGAASLLVCGSDLGHAERRPPLEAAPVVTLYNLMRAGIKGEAALEALFQGQPVFVYCPVVSSGLGTGEEALLSVRRRDHYLSVLDVLRGRGHYEAVKASLLGIISASYFREGSLEKYDRLLARIAASTSVGEEEDGDELLLPSLFRRHWERDGCELCLISRMPARFVTVASLALLAPSGAARDRASSSDPLPIEEAVYDVPGVLLGVWSRCSRTGSFYLEDATGRVRVCSPTASGPLESLDGCLVALGRARYVIEAMGSADRLSYLVASERKGDLARIAELATKKGRAALSLQGRGDPPTGTGGPATVTLSVLVVQGVHRLALLNDDGVMGRMIDCAHHCDIVYGDGAGRSSSSKVHAGDGPISGTLRGMFNRPATIQLEGRSCPPHVGDVIFASTLRDDAGFCRSWGPFVYACRAALLGRSVELLRRPTGGVEALHVCTSQMVADFLASHSCAARARHGTVAVGGREAAEAPRETFIEAIRGRIISKTILCRNLLGATAMQQGPLAPEPGRLLERSRARHASQRVCREMFAKYGIGLSSPEDVLLVTVEEGGFYMNVAFDNVMAHLYPVGFPCGSSVCISNLSKGSEGRLFLASSRSHLLHTDRLALEGGAWGRPAAHLHACDLILDRGGLPGGEERRGGEAPDVLVLIGKLIQLDSVEISYTCPKCQRPALDGRCLIHGLQEGAARLFEAVYTFTDGTCDCRLVFTDPALLEGLIAERPSPLQGQCRQPGSAFATLFSKQRTTTWTRKMAPMRDNLLAIQYDAPLREMAFSCESLSPARTHIAPLRTCAEGGGGSVWRVNAWLRRSAFRVISVAPVAYEECIDFYLNAIV